MRNFRRINAFAWSLAALAGGVRAEIIDFEGPAYASGHSLIGADGWQAAASSPSASEDFLVQSGAAGEGRWAHVRTGNAAVSRSLGDAIGAPPLLDVRWRWRALSDSVRLCVGLAPGAGEARQAVRAQACLEPGGPISARGAGDLALPTAETWRKGSWLYMRMTLDNGAGKFALYVSDDSLRAGERAALPASAMAGGGAPARIELRGEGGSGFADADDLSWEPVAVWQPAGTDTLWSTGKNWSTGTPPDSNTRVLFPAGGLRGCLLDRAASVRGITVAFGAKGVPDLGAQTLSVLGGADFTGGANASGGGRIRFPSARPASLIGPEGVRVLPAVTHDGPGALRLDVRALSAAGFLQSGGVFDFNGFDLNVVGPWRVQGGRPGTLRNLDGRSVIATQGARLEGVSADTLLGLAAPALGWTLNASGTDSVTARFALLGKARATGRPGVAAASIDGGGNSGWSFLDSPARPPAPRALPPGAVFGDSIVARVFAPEGFAGAVVYCLLDPPAAAAPAPGPFPCPDSLVIKVSSVLKAFAVYGSRAGDTARWEFRRGLAAPVLSPRGRDFPDTLRIMALPADSGAVVRYTLDGTAPGPASPAFPSKGILLDSSADLLAAAVRGNEVGSLAAESYSLVPDAPSASPRGGDYSSPVRITLASGSARAVLYYTLDGTDPGPDRGLPPYGGPFLLESGAVLKAVAVAGAGAKARRSPLRIENYTFIVPGKRTLQPGQRLELSGNYALASPLAGASPVDVEVLAADSLVASLRGFRDVLFGIRLSLPPGANAFPKLALHAPAGEPRSLYRLSAPGIVRWITSADTAGVEAAGTYFLGLDTLAPTVKYAGETFTSEDSTRLVVTIEDNVHNLSLDLERSDDPSLGFADREVNPVMILALNVKNPPGAPRPLLVRLRVDDHVNAAAFPAKGPGYPLAQKFTGQVRSPDAFRIGSDPAEPWDLIAIPLADGKPLTLARLRNDNQAPGLRGAAYDQASGSYRFLSGDEAIPPGRSVWLTAPGSLPSLAFTGLQTASLKGSAPRLALRPGWNQVANPGLSRLWWPVPHADTAFYRASLLKGLHAWDAASGEYVPADTLEPWRGYFVYYGGSRDTTVDPLDQAPAAAFAKNSAAGTGLALSLAWRGGSVLRLGTAESAVDGFGMEDDLRPPAREGFGTRLYSDREGAQLGTDLARWRPGAIYSWKVVAGLSARAGSGPGGDSAARSLTGRADRLPPGYAAWAVSRARGLRFPLAGPEGGAGMPWRPGFADTLEVLAGPAAAVEARLGGLLLRAGPFLARTTPQPGGYLLRLDLPGAARLRLTVCSPDGRVAERRVLSLPEGRYLLPGGGRWAPGIYLLRLDAIGPPGAGIPPRMALKLAVP